LQEADTDYCNSDFAQPLATLLPNTCAYVREHKNSFYDELFIDTGSEEGRGLVEACYGPVIQLKTDCGEITEEQLTYIAANWEK